MGVGVKSFEEFLNRFRQVLKAKLFFMGFDDYRFHLKETHKITQIINIAALQNREFE
jgi:hypothetical protein